MEERHLDIDDAIRRGRIKSFYQPIIFLETQKCCALEALARWEDPQQGMLMPQSFVPQLEQRCEVHKLDACMTELVCAELRSRLDGGKQVVPVSVNFSRADFSKADLVGDVLGSLERWHVPKNDIVLEVTESIAGESELLSEKIAAFKRAGFSVWMDDFGTGYSSLSALSKLDFDGLKLDMQFLMSKTTRARVIAKHAVAMARDLGMKTLAEGVTSAEDVEFLKDIGCERAQGSYYSQPLPLDELMSVLESRSIALAS